MRKLYGPGSLCRLDEALVDNISHEQRTARIAISASMTLTIGAVLYGLVFGCWRSPLQAVYSAIKMPLMFFVVAGTSGAVNAMLAQVMGAKLTFRQTVLCVLISMAIACALLGSLSPAVLYFISQLPSGDDPTAMRTYGFLLAAHTFVIGLCGIAGTCRLYHLLISLTKCRRIAVRVLACWILVSGLVGCEVSWVFSPFLARPDVPVPFLNPNAFRSNFFEYLWRTSNGQWESLP